MANKDKPTTPETKPGTAVAPVAQTAVAVAAALNFEADAGAGLEGADASSFAIPFLSILQKTSPQVDETQPQYLEAAKQGMFFENIGNSLFNGKDGVELVPCAYRRVFVRWGARENGGGFKGEMTPEAVEKLQAEGKVVELDGKLYIPAPDGSVNPKRDDRLADTRNHYMLLLRNGGAPQEVLVSLVSTQIKKSKALNSNLANQSATRADGTSYTLATFANVLKATSVAESNDKGSWMGWKFEVARRVDRADVYERAKLFKQSVMKGQVAARYEDTDDSGAAPSSAGSGF